MNLSLIQKYEYIVDPSIKGSICLVPNNSMKFMSVGAKSVSTVYENEPYFLSILEHVSTRTHISVSAFKMTTMYVLRKNGFRLNQSSF